MTELIRDLLKYVRAGALQVVVLPRIRDKRQLSRFEYTRKAYLNILDQLNALSEHSRVNVFTSEGYDWQAWSGSIRNAFQDKVPLAFLWQPVIAKTMVFGGLRDIEATRRRIEFVLSVYGEEIARRLLREDYIGLPKITNAHYLTSANRAHHAYHLASYQNATKKSLFDSRCVVEWGGGYGDMARIVRRLNGQTTYIIIDLPELCALQYIYLSSVESEESVNLVVPGSEILSGRINIVSVVSVLLEKIQISGEAFISTWALTESSEESQLWVFNRNFFNADRILMAYSTDANNRLKDVLLEVGCMQRPITLLKGRNEYAFR